MSENKKQQMSFLTGSKSSRGKKTAASEAMPETPKQMSDEQVMKAARHVMRENKDVLKKLAE